MVLNVQLLNFQLLNDEFPAVTFLAEKFILVLVLKFLFLNVFNSIHFHQQPFVIRCSGNHRVDINFANQPVPGSPFTVKVYDPSKVIVRGIDDGVVSQRANFIGRRHFGYLFVT